MRFLSTETFSRSSAITATGVHGPDEEAREADLRLDRKEDLLATIGLPDTDRDVVADGGELLRRINSHDPDEVMPPPVTRRSLTDRQRDLLRDWVATGAKWERHWAFEAPRRPALPVVKNIAWTANEVDYFTLARLEAEALPPSADASREKLLRRVTLDLTGLPPHGC